jgi:UDP-N-acetylmuramoylalanine--D-glutamate ligase
VSDQARLAIVAQGANGPRIAVALREAQAVGEVSLVATFAEAVERARAVTPSGGVVLLSPGAPSFDQFHDYAERGRRFADLAGFDGLAISGIEGLGVG